MLLKEQMLAKKSFNKKYKTCNINSADPSLDKITIVKTCPELKAGKHLKLKN